MEGQELVRVIGPDEARLNITWNGQNGDLPDTISRDASDEQIRQWATEAVRNGAVPGIPADARVNFADFVIERNAPHEARPHHLTMLRPKTAYGVEQTITIKIVGQEPYKLEEDKGTHKYEALRHFFEDIGYQVAEIKVA